MKCDVAKRNKLPWLEGYTVVKSNNMVVKIRNDDNVTCWVHRTQLRYIPDRPEHLRKQAPLMIPVPVTTSTTNEIPQPPTGGRPLKVGSSDKRRSKIPVLSEKNRQNTTMQSSKTTESKIAAPKTTENVTVRTSRTSRTLTDRRPSQPSANVRQNIVSQPRTRGAQVTRRYPERISRRPPSKYKDYVKY